MRKNFFVTSMYKKTNKQAITLILDTTTTVPHQNEYYIANVYKSIYIHSLMSNAHIGKSGRYPYIR